MCSKGRNFKTKFRPFAFYGGDKIKTEQKHLPFPVRHYAPTCAPDPPEPLTCSRYERCKVCNYMAHGFQCDHGNGKCIFTDVEKIKFAAACQMVRPSDAAEMRQLAENIDQFEFVPDVYSPEAYGKYMIQKSGHFTYDENLEDFYNYGDYGAARLREEDGVFTDRGYVSYHGMTALDELMRPDPAEEYQQEHGLEMEMM